MGRHRGRSKGRGVEAATASASSPGGAASIATPMTPGVARAATRSAVVETSTRSTGVPKSRSNSAMRPARRSCRGTGPSRTTVAIAGHSGGPASAAPHQEWRDTVGVCPARLKADQVGMRSWTLASWPTPWNGRTSATSLRTGSSCSSSPGGRCQQRRARRDADPLEYQGPRRRRSAQPAAGRMRG